MHDIARFIKGFQSFQKRFFCDDSSLYDILKGGQKPRTLVIACIDSRVDPAILTGSQPGELLVVRNVANLVPPYEPDAGLHGVSAALEHGVTRLEVEHIIVLGHACCGGIQTLMTLQEHQDQKTEFLGNWVRIADRARLQTLTDLGDKPTDLQQQACEQAAILVSLENLLTFPWVKQRVEAGTLFLHGWYFDLRTGDLMSYLPESGAFEPLAPRCW
ncbi:carbonic anhydrase [Megalodesulfovibrio gigas]|uniref:Carbonic anhydrase n=1 Tax=Megalodesulfovibrio gigas (strain ATCC 19364 / DSM 1382 / NCIMB 9332 / VKM B-1759) TaxID=1121448 RepID=T2GG81_MEGG1|nr:carbonic anhydrase [Megalodesulfovibrio gigas]AGW15191.1 putative carbonic anhydrase [Megalodesulfovibrio gigas DSM 1382 = ATCC 19364]